MVKKSAIKTAIEFFCERYSILELRHNRLIKSFDRLLIQMEAVDQKAQMRRHIKETLAADKAMEEHHKRCEKCYQRIKDGHKEDCENG